MKRQTITLFLGKNACKTPELRNLDKTLPCEGCKNKANCQETKTVIAETQGNYAIHATKSDYYQEQRKYTVTHIPTGSSYYEAFQNKEMAKAFVEALLAKGYTGEDLIQEYSRGLKTDVMGILKMVFAR